MENEKYTAAAKRLELYAVYKFQVENCEHLRRDDLSKAELKAEMFCLRRSVLRLPECKEKLLLYNRYIRGYTMEECAELLGMSRRSVFRLRLRALGLYIRLNPDGEDVKVL